MSRLVTAIVADYNTRDVIDVATGKALCNCTSTHAAKEWAADMGYTWTTKRQDRDRAIHNYNRWVRQQEAA